MSVAISQLGKDNVELNNLIKEYKSYMDTYVDEMDYLNMNGGIHTGIEIDNTGVSHEHSIDLYGGFICYLLNGKYNTFTGKMALNSDSRSTNGNYWYEIYGDESLLYTSQKFTAGVLPIDFSIDVSNINVLKIVVKADSFDGWVSSNNIFLYDAILKSNK